MFDVLQTVLFIYTLQYKHAIHELSFYCYFKSNTVQKKTLVVKKLWRVNLVAELAKNFDGKFSGGALKSVQVKEITILDVS